MTDTAPNTDLVLAPPRAELDTFQVAEHAWRLAQRVCKTEFVPKGLQNRPEATLAAILKGHELDLPPMTALASIHVINGRPGLSAELQRALVLRAGHELWCEDLSATRVTWAGRRADNGRELRVTWTLDDAKRAGLAGKDVWRAYPRNMLSARASSDLCRSLFPDVIGGMYTVEELEDIDDGGTAAPHEGLPAPAPANGTVRKATAPTARPRKKAAAKKAATPVDNRPPPPPLPGEEGFDAIDETAKRRNQQIAMRCQELGVDRARVIAAVTGGRKTSARALTAEERDAVLEAIRQMGTGALRLVERDGEPTLVDTADAPPLVDDVVDAEIVDDTDRWADTFGSEHTWDRSTWLAFIDDRGVAPGDLKVEAQRLAIEMGEPAPAKIEDLAGRESLCQLLRAWVEDRAAGDG